MAKQFDPLGMNTPGREGTGMATLYDSGSFDGAKFVATEVERERVERKAEQDRLRDEKKQRDDKLFDIVTKYQGVTEKGAAEISQTVNQGIDALADIMSKPGQEPFDLNTEAGKFTATLMGQLAWQQNADNEYKKAVDEAMKAARTNPTKYDIDHLEETLKAGYEAPDIATRMKVTQEKGGLLIPYYDYKQLLPQLKTPINKTSNVAGGKRLDVFTFDDDELNQDIGMILGSGQADPFIQSFEKDKARGKIPEGINTLNDYLFQQLRRLDAVAPDKLDEEIKRAQMIVETSKPIISCAALVLDAQKLKNSAIGGLTALPNMLECKDE